jgi:hypothetical protein
VSWGVGKIIQKLIHTGTPSFLVIASAIGLNDKEFQ